jgi:hypothetical protein
MLWVSDRPTLGKYSTEGESIGTLTDQLPSPRALYDRSGNPRPHSPLRVQHDTARWPRPFRKDWHVVPTTRRAPPRPGAFAVLDGPFALQQGWLALAAGSGTRS